ncbi:hypothetical protein KC319_g15813, partial [Hortaea werneckii]
DSSNARIIITDHAHTLLLMLEYIYLGHYDVRDTLELPTGQVYGKDHPAISHIRVHAFGKKYKVSGLAALALEKLRCSESYIAAEDFVDVLRVAYQYSAEETDDVRTDLLAVALARFDDLAASQVILTQLAEFEELRDFAAQLLPHVFKFAAARYSKSEDLKLKRLETQVRGREGKIQRLESQVHGCEAKIKRLQSHVRGCEGKLQRFKSAARDWLGNVEIAKTEFLMLKQQASQYERERDEAREMLRRDVQGCGECGGRLICIKGCP